MIEEAQGFEEYEAYEEFEEEFNAPWADDDWADPVSSAEYNDKKKVISAVLDKQSFTTNEVFVLRTFYGLDCKDKKLCEIANLLNLSYARILQIHSRALSKCRLHSSKELLEVFV